MLALNGSQWAKAVIRRDRPANVRRRWKEDIAGLMHGRQGRPMKSETAKLPKGQSYPLKPSALEAMLATARIDLDTHLIRSPGKLFDAHFWPRNAKIPHERLYVRAGSVPAEHAAGTRDRIENQALPALVEWIGNILAQDPQSPVRREQQYLDLTER